MKTIQSNIKKAKKYLDNDDCIAVPTETVYGLAGNAYSNKAVKKIFKLKKRPSKNPLIVHYYNFNKLKKSHSNYFNKPIIYEKSVIEYKIEEENFKKRLFYNFKLRNSRHSKYVVGMALLNKTLYI